MALKHRLNDLEKRIAPPAKGECSECGLPLADVRWKGQAQVSVGWWSPGDPEAPPCRACGQKRVFRIEFDRAG